MLRSVVFSVYRCRNLRFLDLLVLQFCVVSSCFRRRSTLMLLLHVHRILFRIKTIRFSDGAFFETRLVQVYRSRHDFITDMRLLAQNALYFNGSGHEVYQCASEMRDFVLQDLRDHEEEMALLETTLGTLEESKASLDALKPEIDRDMEAIALWEHEHKLEVQRVAQEVEE